MHERRKRGGKERETWIEQERARELELELPRELES
jgi:hypothetical protein